MWCSLVQNHVIAGPAPFPWPNPCINHAPPITTVKSFHNQRITGVKQIEEWRTYSQLWLWEGLIAALLKKPGNAQLDHNMIWHHWSRQLWPISDVKKGHKLTFYWLPNLLHNAASYFHTVQEPMNVFFQSGHRLMANVFKSIVAVDWKKSHSMKPTQYGNPRLF